MSQSPSCAEVQSIDKSLKTIKLKTCKFWHDIITSVVGASSNINAHMFRQVPRPVFPVESIHNHALQPLDPRQRAEETECGRDRVRLLDLINLSLEVIEGRWLITGDRTKNDAYTGSEYRSWIRRPERGKKGYETRVVRFIGPDMGFRDRHVSFGRADGVRQLPVTSKISVLNCFVSEPFKLLQRTDRG